MSTPMPLIISILSQYECLQRTARQLSALDLLNLATACSQLYTLIRKSELVFDRLKRVALCDGRGLKARQEFQSMYNPYHRYRQGKGSRPKNDEEIEVRVWNVKCDPRNALPCIRCEVNVCEECRYVPRSRDGVWDRSRRRPHWDTTGSTRAIIAYCSPCDENIERDLPTRLSEFCDCDQYKRWICLPCKIKEDQPEEHYFNTRTKEVWEPFEPDIELGLVLDCHVAHRAFWCPCGERAPKDATVRCAWCRRRHNLVTWHTEDPHIIPVFDNDPCFPILRRDPYALIPAPPIMYPPLGYMGPIAP